MKAVLLDGYGGPEMLRLGEAPMPQPREGELLIRVEAIGVNPADGKWRSGMFASLVPLIFPHIPGYDIAGTVEAGAGLPKGTRVVAMLDPVQQGAYAEYAVVPRSAVAEMPEGLDAFTAAAVPTPGLTGVQIIEDQLDVQAGERVLITGATGAVGRWAVHAAKLRGAEVVAGVRSAHLQAALALGAAAVAVPGERWDGGAFDAVADMIGGPDIGALCRSVRPGGRIATAATNPIPPAGLPAIPEFFTVMPDGMRLAALLRKVARGAVAVPIAAVLPLERAGEAQAIVDAGAKGKVILTP
jgi:NADPH:quinone reductase-like Zn-dependent oxidoreductase